MRLIEPGGHARSVVAIPARNECRRIGACLAALAADRCEHPLLVVLLVNNSTDGTADAARHAGAACGVPLVVREAHLPAARAHAGEARRLAMAAASELCGPRDLLLTTDADARVVPGWRRGNHRAIEAGADLVCGRAVIDPGEARAIPAHLHADDARETEYAGLLDRIAALVVPDAADPWPRHGEESGASLAIRPDLFRAAGGVPAVRLGEDRALVERHRLRDARIRHDPTLAVIVSGRLEGRAAGGMADTMRRRMTRQDDHVDDRLEPVSERIRRIALRSHFRRLASRLRPPSPLEAARFGVDSALLDAALACAWRASGWDMVERANPHLRTRTPIRHAALAPHLARAERVVACLAATDAPMPRRADGHAADSRSSRYDAARSVARGVSTSPARATNSDAAASPVHGVSVGPVQFASTTAAPGRSERETRVARVPISSGDRK